MILLTIVSMSLVKFADPLPLVGGGKNRSGEIILFGPAVLIPVSSVDPLIAIGRIPVFAVFPTTQRIFSGERPPPNGDRM